MRAVGGPAAYRPGIRRPLRPVLVLVLLAVVAYLGISWKYADGVTRVVRDPLKKTPAYVQAAYEDVSFKSRDGLTLKGWWFPAPGSTAATKAVVMVHGKDQNRIDSSFDPGRIARFLLADGWSVLLFEMRGHGQSDGLRWGLGQYEPNDILGAIDLAAQKIGQSRSRVATIGESMGGGSVLMTVGTDPSSGLVVVDSAYASASAVVDEVGPQYSGLRSSRRDSCSRRGSCTGWISARSSRLTSCARIRSARSYSSSARMTTPSRCITASI